LTASLLRLAAAALALWLAAQTAVRWHAEAAYTSGLRAPPGDAPGGPSVDVRDALADPTLDVPGRLDAYRVACDRDPRQPLYLLRAAQIELRRAAHAEDPAEAERTIDGALERLARAAALQPLDGRIHDTTARALALRGAPDGEVLAACRRALATAPRYGGILEDVTLLAVRAWRRSGDPAALGVALESARIGYEIVDGRDPTFPPLYSVPGTYRLGPVRSASLDEIRMAAAADPALAEVAARWIAPDRPEDARSLRAWAAAERQP